MQSANGRTLWLHALLSDTGVSDVLTRYHSCRQLCPNRHVHLQGSTKILHERERGVTHMNPSPLRRSQWVNLNCLNFHPLRHMKSSSYSSTLLYLSAIEALEVMFSSCDQRFSPRPFG